MADGDVGFLDALGVWRRNIEQQIHFGGQCTARLTRQGDYVSAAGTARFRTAKNIRTISAGGQRNQNVGWRDQRLNLARENVFETIVVAGGGEDGRICGQRES